MNSATITLGSCCCRPLCHHCLFCACSRRPLKPTTSLGYLGRAAHPKLTNRSSLNIVALAMIGSCCDPSFLKVKQCSMSSQKLSSTTKHPWRWSWEVSKLAAVALAMLGSAHLIVLKRFHAKFMELAVAKPRDQHLRAPSLSEILDADRTAWSAVTELLYDSNLTLNDVLNEIAFCRQVFHTSLAPRPKPLQQPKLEHPKRRPELPKPLPKKPKQDTALADAPKPQPATPKGAQWDKTWVRRLPDGKGICMRFNLNKCKSGKTCRFAHVCPVPKANGEPCAGAHTAARHKSAPH